MNDIAFNDNTISAGIIDTKKIDTNVTDLAERAILIVSAICTVAVLGMVLWYSRYGIDFTDESFYLVWMANPFNYKVSVTQFGFIYHPLYELLDGNIAALIQANILITFCLAWVLCKIFLKNVFGSQVLRGAPGLVIAGSIATVVTSSLIFSGLWLPAPSYNSLALQALLVAAIGLLLADKQSARTSLAGWILIGIGGWLAFMAKPTTAAALGLCVAFYLLAARKFSIRLLAISLVTAAGLLVLSALAIDGSIIAFVYRLKGGFELSNTLGGGHTFAQLLRLDDFQLGERAKFLLVDATAVISLAAYFLQVENKWLRRCGALISIGFASASLVIIFGFTHQTLNAGPFQCLLLWAVPMGAILAGVASSRFKCLFQISRPRWALALSFLVFPHIYAFGTNNNYWSTGALAGLFWILAGLVLLSPIARNPRLPTLLLSLGLAVQLLTVVQIQTGIEAPYRQPQPLRENDVTLEIGKPGSTLIIPKAFGQYLADTVNTAKQAGFKTGTPMIDLSGQSPGILYAIGASSIGQPWTIGGYPGSDKLAVIMLKMVPCEEISKAWLLVEPDGPRKISPEILFSLGANLATDFEIVGTFKTAEGAGGYKEIRAQQLLRPVRSVENAMRACVADRMAKQ